MHLHCSAKARDWSSSGIPVQAQPHGTKKSIAWNRGNLRLWASCRDLAHLMDTVCTGLDRREAEVRYRVERMIMRSGIGPAP